MGGLRQRKPQIHNLPEYTDIDACGSESIEEVIYDEGNFVGRSTLQMSDYEEPTLIPLPPQTIQLKSSDIPDEDFPSYNITFQQNKLHSQDNAPSLEYSQIVLPKNVITPNIQVIP